MIFLFFLSFHLFRSTTDPSCVPSITVRSTHSSSSSAHRRYRQKSKNRKGKNNKNDTHQFGHMKKQIVRRREHFLVLIERRKEIITWLFARSMFSIATTIRRKRCGAVSQRFSQNVVRMSSRFLFLLSGALFFPRQKFRIGFLFFFFSHLFWITADGWHSIISALFFSTARKRRYNSDKRKKNNLSLSCFPSLRQLTHRSTLFKPTNGELRVFRFRE
jgi:hypothetical protein